MILILILVSILKAKGWMYEDIPKMALQTAAVEQHKGNSLVFDLSCIDKKLQDALLPFQFEGIQ